MSYIEPKVRTMSHIHLRGVAIADASFEPSSMFFRREDSMLHLG